MRIVGAAVFAAVAVSCAKQPPAPEIPLLEPGLWTFEIETRPKKFWRFIISFPGSEIRRGS